MININKLVGGSITITTKPVANPKTKITFTDGSVEEYDWSGEINQQTMIDSGLYDGDSYVWIKKTQTIEIGSDVTSIGGMLFSNCNWLTNITIPDSVTSIGVQAFYGCRGLTSLMIGNGVTNIDSGAFYSCNSLTSVIIGNGVTSIGFYTFYDCTSLTSVTFSGKNKATVQGMANYSWDIKSGCVIHCTDGDITI